MFITTATAIYSLGHGLHTLTAVPRSIQPSTLHGTVKWVSAFRLSNNKWWWWMRTVAALSGGLTVQVGWLGLRVGGHLALSLHSSNKLGELSLLVVVVIVCITSHWTAALSAKWSCGRPPSSLVSGQLLTMWNIVWRLPHWHLSLVARPHLLWQDAQWPWLVPKWYIFD